MAAAMSSIRRSVSGEPCLRQQQRRQQAGLWWCRITIAVLCWVAACSHLVALTLLQLPIRHPHQLLCAIHSTVVCAEICSDDSQSSSLPLLSCTLAEGLLAGHGASRCSKQLATSISGFFELNKDKVDVYALISARCCLSLALASLPPCAALLTDDVECLKKYIDVAGVCFWLR